MITAEEIRKAFVRDEPDEDGNWTNTDTEILSYAGWFPGSREPRHILDVEADIDLQKLADWINGKME